MRRSLAFGGILALALSAGAPWLPIAGAQVNVPAFCQARVDASTAIAQEDEAATSATLDTLRVSAPPDVQAAAVMLADLFEKKGHKAFGSKKVAKAAGAIDEYVVANCGFLVLEVSGIDYEYQGIPAALVAGTQVFQLTNDAPKESHELVLMLVKPGVNISAKKLVSLPEKKADKKATFVGAAFVEPGESAILIGSLEPGRYVYACFVATGGSTSADEHGGGEHGGGGDKPHWKNGMVGEFEVVGGQ